MLRKVARLRRWARRMPPRSPFTKMMSALSIATSVPVPMAIPTSAAARAGASSIPSPAELHTPDELGVLRLERGDDTAYASTDRTEELLVAWFGLLMLQPLLHDLLTAMGIDNRVPEQPAEPRHRTVVVADRVRLLHRFHVSRLECVARSLFCPEPGSQKSEEFALAVQQWLGQPGGLLHATSTAQFTSAWRYSSRATRSSSPPVSTRERTRTTGRG